MAGRAKGTLREVGPDSVRIHASPLFKLRTVCSQTHTLLQVVTCYHSPWPGPNQPLVCAVCACVAKEPQMREDAPAIQMCTCACTTHERFCAPTLASKACARRLTCAFRPLRGGDGRHHPTFWAPPTTREHPRPSPFLDALPRPSRRAQSLAWWRAPPPSSPPPPPPSR